MITDNSVRLPQSPACVPASPTSDDPARLLIRIYRQAGLSVEAAQRCALADFRCSFPQFLTVAV